jgi:hypothetical protein
MSDKRCQTSRSAKSPPRAVCEEVNFVEVEFPHSITPRLVITCGEGLSLLVEHQAAIPLAVKFITTFRALEKGGAL